MSHLVFRIIAVLAITFASLSIAEAPRAQSVASKILCEGSVVDGPCDQMSSTPKRGEPAYYQFVLYAGATQVSLPVTEDYPASFSPLNSANPVRCTVTAGSNIGSPVPITTVTGSQPLQFTADLQAGQEATCAMEGAFITAGGTATNTVSTAGSSDSETTVISSDAELDQDLKITKELLTPTALPLNISGTPQRAKYRITVTTDKLVYLGDFFSVYDQLALFPNGVSVTATLVPGSVCRLMNSGVLSNCVQTSSFNGDVTSPAWQDFASWGIASGSIVALQPGDAIIIEYEVEYSVQPDVGCVKADSSEGIRNRAFLGLAGSGQALRDNNNSNNDTAGNSNSDLPLVTSVYNVDPDCNALPPSGPASTLQLDKITTSTGVQPWIGTAEYVISLSNLDPSTEIFDVEIADVYENQPGTPNFRARLIRAAWNSCAPVTSTCTQISPTPPTFPGTAGPLHYFSSYYDRKTMWTGSVDKVESDQIRVDLQVYLHSIECDYSPLVGPKTIRNWVEVRHKMRSIDPDTGQTIVTQHVKRDYADITVAAPPACQISVQKTSLPVANVGNDQIVFDEWKRYQIVYSALPSAPNTLKIRTLIDALRIGNQFYATGLSFAYEWTCEDQSGGGVRGFQANGTGSATVNHVSAPHQGVRIMQHPGVVEFDPGASLKCDVRVKVQKPAPSDPYCFSDGIPRLQNLALMDGSAYFNANMPWPHAAQGTSWAAASDALPNCFNLIVNKNASPGVVSPNGGPITYTIQYINPNLPGTSGDLNFPAGPYGQNTRAIFVDRFTTDNPQSALPNGTLSYTNPNPCQPANTNPCDIFLSNGGQAVTAINSIPAGGSLTYSYTVSGPYTPHQLCNDIRGEMARNGATFHKRWYPKDIATWQSDTCTLVRGSLQVNKQAITPTWINFDAATQFFIDVECDTPSGFSDINRQMAVNGSNPSAAITQIPIGSTCEIEEVDLTDPDQWGECEWRTPVYTKGDTILIDGSADPHQLDIVNQLDCEAPPGGQLSILKELISPQECPTINALCTFRITVTNIGSAPYSGPVKLTDEFTNNFNPAGYYFIPNMPSPLPAPWQCAQPSGNLPVECSAGLISLMPGQSSSFDMTFDMPNSGTNCAVLNVPAQAPTPESCVFVGSPPEIGTDDLLIEKATIFDECPGAAVGSGQCLFQITITNTGPNQLDGSLSFRDVISGGAAGAGTVAVISVSPAGWSCNTVNAVTTECTNNAVSLSPGQSITVDLLLNLQYAAPVGENCADIDQVDPFGRLTKACSPIRDTPPADAATLTLKKTKVTTSTCTLGAQNCTFRFEITNSGAADFTGPLSFEDEFSAASGWSNLSVQSISKNGWICSLSAPIYTCSNNVVHITQGSTYTLDITFDYGPGFSARLNCARLVQGTAKGPDSCTSIAQMRITKEIVSAQDCAVTGNRHCTFRITLENAWAGMHTGPVRVTDSLDFGGIVQNIPVIGQPTNGWTCAVGGNGVGLDCDHPGPIFGNSGVASFEITLDLSSVPPIHIGNCAEIAQPQQQMRERSCVQLGPIWEPPLRIRNPRDATRKERRMLDEVRQRARNQAAEPEEKRRGFRLPKVQINIGGIRIGGGRKRTEEREDKPREETPREQPRTEPKVDAAGNPIGG